MKICLPLLLLCPKMMSQKITEISFIIFGLKSTNWSIIAENMKFYEDDCCCTNSTPVVMTLPFCQPEYKELLYMVGICRNPEVINDNELEGGCHTHSIRNLIHGNRTHALVKPFQINLIFSQPLNKNGGVLKSIYQCIHIQALRFQRIGFSKR